MIFIKNMKYRSLILYLIIVSFFCGFGYFLYEFSTQSVNWAFSPINKHLKDGKISGGKIIDVNGEVLLQTDSGKRVYNKDENIRKATLHTIGDGSSLIPTSVQSRYNSELFGYNLITGFGTPPYLVSNRNIKLTIDSKLCAEVSKKFKDKKGTALAYNYKTGEILCMVSLPTYDVNNRPNFDDDTDGTYEGAYLNRAISSAYTPGSIFKVFTTLASLDFMNDAENRKYECQKVKIIDGEKVTCMKSHGKLGLKEALAQSCDIVFGDIAVEIGKEKMTSKMEELGFNMPQYFENLEICKSNYDVKNASKADLAWSGIGQYTDTANPIHALKLMGAIANGGVAVEPYVVKSIFLDSDESIVKSNKPTEKRIISEVTSEKIKEMMRYTMKNKYKDSMFGGIEMCAKTGTAEVGEGKLPHGWIIGFSYDKKFPIAFVVVVENGDFGIKSAGPIASFMIKSIYNSTSNKNK